MSEETVIFVLDTKIQNNDDFFFDWILDQVEDDILILCADWMSDRVGDDILTHNADTTYKKRPH